MNEHGVVRVGGGRGFVVEAEADRLVVTAAHCLPFFPPCAPSSDTAERTYRELVGALGVQPTVWVECLFVDPVADVAVLGPPDSQDLFEQWDQYQEFVDNTVPFRVTAPTPGQAWLLSLDGAWFRCDIELVTVPPNGGALWIDVAAQRIVGGMSGSPILASDGSAIGVLCTSTEVGDDKHGPNPWLTGNLPGWLLGRLAAAGREAGSG